MSIRKYATKIKDFANEHITDEIYIVALIILVGFAGFGLGRLSIIEEQRMPVRIEYPENVSALVLNTQKNNFEKEENMVESGLLVASKNGSKYHFPWCSGAQRMKEENKIWFASAAEATQAGYEPAKNCKGLK